MLASVHYLCSSDSYNSQQVIHASHSVQYSAKTAVLVLLLQISCTGQWCSDYSKDNIAAILTALLESRLAP